MSIFATPVKESLRTLATGSCNKVITSGNKVLNNSSGGDSKDRTDICIARHCLNLQLKGFVECSISCSRGRYDTLHGIERTDKKSERCLMTPI
mmetsp:Transcript_21169/g.20507  ORF Transcript_21169/g.20507 Transcript_21169/m.20507 type:complete len:93 (+) Transcript_21169:1650-1928(+)